MCSTVGSIRHPGDEELNKVSENWMEVSRAFGSEREEDISGTVMMSGVVCKFGVVGNLGSL